MYDFYFHPQAEVELKKLNRSVQLLFAKKLKQILQSPELGVKLGHKNHLNLTGFHKAYFNNKRHRIVYQIEENTIKIYIIAIGKREEMDVYRKAAQRVKEDS